MLSNRQERTLLGNKDVLTYERPTRPQLAQFFRRALKGKPVEEIAAMLTNPGRDIFEYALLVSNGKTCQRMSLRYNPQRLDVQANKHKTIFQAMQSDSFFDGMARLWLKIEKKLSTADLLYVMIQYGINGSQYVNEFPPHLARDIYREFKLDRRSRILDPCAGWGGRMIGASVVSNHYTGFEPASYTATGLWELADDLKELTGSFEANIYCKPYEDARLRPARFDFALTSPPYYDTEKYSDEPTQSYMRYTTFDDWVIGFYLPFIDKTMMALKDDGAFVLNVGDRKYPLPNVLKEHCARVGIKVNKLPSRMSMGGGLRTQGEGEVFFVLTKELK
jgi:hypothetical protein